MKFVKMQGAGNDYVYVDCFKEEVKNPREIAIKVSDRHFGVGSNGIGKCCYTACRLIADLQVVSTCYQVAKSTTCLVIQTTIY